MIINSLLRFAVVFIWVAVRFVLSSVSLGVGLWSMYAQHTIGGLLFVFAAWCWLGGWQWRIKPELQTGLPQALAVGALFWGCVFW